MLYSSLSTLLTSGIFVPVGPLLPHTQIVTATPILLHIDFCTGFAFYHSSCWKPSFAKIGHHQKVLHHWSHGLSPAVVPAELGRCHIRLCPFVSERCLGALGGGLLCSRVWGLECSELSPAALQPSWFLRVGVTVTLLIKFSVRDLTVLQWLSFMFLVCVVNEGFMLKCNMFE